MITRDKEIVSALQAALTERIGPERFELWFGSSVRLKPTGSELHVVASDRFILDRLRGSLRSDLQASCDEVLGPSTSIRFQLDESQAKTAPSPAAKPSGQTTKQRKQVSIHRPHQARGPLQMGLDDFVCGAGNRIAHTGAVRVAQQPGMISPFFVYGPTGVGKTHLLQAIASAIRESRAARRVVSLSAEQFAGDFLEALRGSGMPSFRRKYRDVEVLLVDDLQFMAGKRATIVELQHTVDALLRNGRQLVLAADRAPSELGGLGTELIARISGGLVCGMEPAEEETRLQILKQASRRRGDRVPEEVLRLIATRLQGDARQLAGALNRLQLTSDALGAKVTCSLAERALEDLFRCSRRVVRLPDIEDAVCDVFGVDAESLQSGRKSKAISQPRMLAMWLARRYTRAAFAEIGEYFGNRSHSTVISAQKRVEDWMQGNAEVQLRHGQCQIQDALRRVEARLQTG